MDGTARRCAILPGWHSLAWRAEPSRARLHTEAAESGDIARNLGQRADTDGVAAVRGALHHSEGGLAARRCAILPGWPTRAWRAGHTRARVRKEATESGDLARDLGNAPTQTA